jgi:hypothetical protein
MPVYLLRHSDGFLNENSLFRKSQIPSTKSHRSFSWFQVSGVRSKQVQGSAQPLTAEAASLIEKETSALRSLMRGF